MLLIYLISLFGCTLGLESLKLSDSGDFDIDNFDESEDSLADNAPPLDSEETDSSNTSTATSTESTDTTTSTGTATTTDSSTSSETGTSTGSGIQLYSLSPHYGSTNGGTQVTLNGGPFDNSTVVQFGGNTASIISNSGTSIVVNSPSASTEGAVDISIQNSSGSITASASYLYFQDGSNLTGAIGYMNFFELTGSYWSSYDSGGNAAMAFVVPLDFQWWQFYVPTMGSCTDGSYSYPQAVNILDLAEDPFYVSRSSTTIPLYYNTSTYIHESGDLTASQIPSGASFNLNSFVGPLVGFSVNNLFTTSTAPTVSSPAISGLSPPTIYQNQSFSWQPSGASWIMIEMGVLNSAATAFDATVICIVPDTGAFSIPSGLFSVWESNRQVNVYFSRALEGNVMLSHNNSTARIVSMYTLIGAGFAY